MTEILLDGKAVKKIHFHVTGLDGEFLWIHFELENGEAYDTYHFKGVN